MNARGYDLIKHMKQSVAIVKLTIMLTSITSTWRMETGITELVENR